MRGSCGPGAGNKQAEDAGGLGVGNRQAEDEGGLGVGNKQAEGVGGLGAGSGQAEDLGRVPTQGPALSKRMRHVLKLVTSHKTVADVGCDHGYMAIELIRSGKAERVIAMDINGGPLARAKANLAAYGLCDAIETRLCDGMAALCPGEVQSVICAGMGGKTICGIMERSRLLVQELEELVLQPQSELHIVRSYLRENGFCIVAEDMVSEDGKFYPMMRVIPAVSAEAVCGKGGREITEPKGPRSMEHARAAGESAVCEAEHARAAEERAVCEAEHARAAGGSAVCEAEHARAAEKERRCIVEQNVPGSLKTENADQGRIGTQRQRVEDWYGPCLLAEAHPVLRRYLQRERMVCEEVLQNLAQTDSERGRLRREELMQRLSDIALAEEICAQSS